MDNNKKSDYNPSNTKNIKICNLKLDNLDNYLEIELEAFYEKLKFIYSYNKGAALNIIRSEISRNINNGRYYTATINGRITGIIEVITCENLKNYTRSFRTYVKYLGFLKACKAFILASIEIPRLKSGTVYIDTVAVEKNNRRKGTAKKMLSFVEHLARKNGKSTLTLWVAAENRSACNLYKKFGFTEIIKRSSRLAEKYLGYRDWIYMGKEIS